MRPLNLQQFELECVGGCMQAPGPTADGYTALIFADDDEDGLLVMGCPPGADPTEQLVYVKTLFSVGTHDYAGMATAVRWSPDDATPSFDVWCLTTIRRDEPGRLVVVRCESKDWWRIDLLNAPWFALSTIGAMRGWLDGKFTEMKMVSDDRLFGTVFDEPPPTDRSGNI